MSEEAIEPTRRDVLGMLFGGVAAAALPLGLLAQGHATRLTRADDAFLGEMERRACLFFTEQTGAKTGQVLDRAAAANTDGRRDPRTNASIAATGFGLAGLCIADQRGYGEKTALKEQVLRTLRFHASELRHEHGFFFHFNDVDTGEPMSWSEVSSIDTSLLLCGVLTARAHFASDPEIVRLATTIYERVDWPWMMNGGPQFSMGWNPGKGFLSATWNHYCELMMIPLLAMGSPTYPVDATAWTAWSRPTISYDGLTYIGGGDPLFIHQYSHAFFDFRNRRDAYANYFENSVTATRAHKAFCMDLAEKDSALPYKETHWGITASDSEGGYQAWGGPPLIGKVDGSVVPCATAGSLPFLPADCLKVLRALKDGYGDRCWGRYGFCDALHPQNNWYDADVLGIDLGIGLLMAENLRSGFVWETFARNREVGIAMKKAGFRRDKSHAARR